MMAEQEDMPNKLMIHLNIKNPEDQLSVQIKEIISDNAGCVGTSGNLTRACIDASM
jgi:hypothetical protein